MYLCVIARVRTIIVLIRRLIAFIRALIALVRTIIVSYSALSPFDGLRMTNEIWDWKMKGEGGYQDSALSPFDGLRMTNMLCFRSVVSAVQQNTYQFHPYFSLNLPPLYTFKCVGNQVVGRSADINFTGFTAGFHT